MCRGKNSRKKEKTTNHIGITIASGMEEMLLQKFMLPL
jgi:hypothetical protein